MAISLRGKFMKYMLILSLLSVSPSLKHPVKRDVLIEEEIKKQPKKVLFFPVNNENQPNIWINKPTRESDSFLMELKREYNYIDWGDKLGVVKFLTEKISKMKRDHGGFPGELAKYSGEISKIDTINANTFLEMNHPQCVERSLFLSALLKRLGIKSWIVIIEFKTKYDIIRHTVVEAEINEKNYIIDPDENIIGKGIRDYIKKWKDRDYGKYYIVLFGDSIDYNAVKNIDEKKLDYIFPYKVVEIKMK